MKLSELKGERAVEVIADLVEPITNIALDWDNLEMFRGKKKEGETDREMGIREFKKKIPNLLKTHKSDVLAILCAVNGSDPNELSLRDIIKGTVELANDPEFKELFLSSVSMGAGTPPTESSADAEVTEPES